MRTTALSFAIALLACVPAQSQIATGCTAATADDLASAALTLGNFVSILEYTALDQSAFPKELETQIAERNATHEKLIAELQKLIISTEDLSYAIRTCAR